MAKANVWTLECLQSGNEMKCRNKFWFNILTMWIVNQYGMSCLLSGIIVSMTHRKCQGVCFMVKC